MLITIHRIVFDYSPFLIVAPLLTTARMRVKSLPSCTFHLAPCSITVGAQFIGAPPHPAWGAGNHRPVPLPDQSAMNTVLPVPGQGAAPTHHPYAPIHP